MRSTRYGHPAAHALPAATPQASQTLIPDKAGHPWQLLLCVSLAAVLGIAAGRAVIAYSGSICVVDGQSMAPTFDSGARVYTAPIATPLERGDIVLVDDGRKEYALKRIVGLPGETVQLWRGYLFINSRMLREPYLPKHTYTFPDEQAETYVFHLGAREFFLLGDNRRVSVDSRSYGPVAENQIKSRVPEGNHVRPRFDAFTLPTAGKRTIRPL